MTIPEAWLWLTELWEQPPVFYNDYYNIYRVRFLHDRFKAFECGLCACINDMVYTNMITKEQSDEMYKPISLLPTQYNRFYCFPCTLDGAIQRAAFCREQYIKESQK